MLHDPSLFSPNPIVDDPGNIFPVPISKKKNTFSFVCKGASKKHFRPQMKEQMINAKCMSKSVLVLLDIHA